MAERASEMVLRRLREGAKRMGRSEVRDATIDRLVEACNAIESGAAANLVKAVTGKDHGLRLNPKINPSTVEKYVKARGKTDKAWTGPTRVTIQKDPDLLAYVEARDDERVKPDLPKRPTPKRRQIEDAISLLPSVEVRMELRHELDAGRAAQRHLDILRAGLRKIPGVDINALLHGAGAPQIEAKSTLANGQAGNAIPAMSDEDRGILKMLIDRLNNPDELSRVGMEFENNRVRHKTTRQALVKPAEMALLRRLAGMTD
ncbi:hypothetical protein JHL17_30075 [Azospirillum sp. YIM B02556]|uniref:Uncharacterized protein n=1 Tax=Azospirillum endophyticum TaxID=2800326 RepID=A0ABS1FDY8_9PROT|nr:hypothetical protein [Azospirillum endophyticum]MBK1841655.1 hypothetical protein [Azospirillum endophyticum]